MTTPVKIRSPRVARKRSERVGRLLAVAAKVFAEKGYEAANLEEIAARLDMRGPSLYHYFASKEELLLACVSYINSITLKRLKDVAGESGSPLARLKRLFYEQVLIQVRDFPEFVPLFVTLQAPDSAIRKRLDDVRRSHWDVYVRLAHEAVQAGEIPSRLWKLSLRVALGAVTSVHQWYNPRGTLTAEALAEEVSSRTIRLLQQG